jgi:hypothetical protein
MTTKRNDAPAQKSKVNSAASSVLGVTGGVVAGNDITNALSELRTTVSVGAITVESLLKHTLKEAHDPRTGLVDAKRFAAVTGITIPEMAKILERTPRGLQKNPTAPTLQEKLTRMITLYVALLDTFDRSDEYVRIWLRAPHPDLGNRTPISCLEEGHLDVVEPLVRAMESGQPS